VPTPSRTRLRRVTLLFKFRYDSAQQTREVQMTVSLKTVFLIGAACAVLHVSLLAALPVIAGYLLCDFLTNDGTEGDGRTRLVK
jgi:hypothetical protein